MESNKIPGQLSSVSEASLSISDDSFSFRKQYKQYKQEGLNDRSGFTDEPSAMEDEDAGLRQSNDS